MGPVRQNPIQRTVSLFICVCIALCTIVAHNIAQNRPDNFFVSDIAIFVLKRDVKLQLTN